MKKYQYDEAIDQAGIVAGRSDAGWNSRFVNALDRRSLKLVFENPIPREDGCDNMAPVPFEEGWKYTYPSWIVPKEP